MSEPEDVDMAAALQAMVSSTSGLTPNGLHVVRSDQDVDPDAERRATVAGWLRGLYGPAETGWLSITHRQDGGDLVTDWVPVEDLDGAAQVIIERSLTADIWCGVATRRQRLSPGQRGGADQCAALPALWADIDVQHPQHHAATDLSPTFDAARSLIQAFVLAPTAVVHTGHGLQAWWALAEPLDAQGEEAGTLLDRLEATWLRLAAERGWSIDAVWDLARMLRMPGTFNRKGNGSEAVPVLVEQADWRRRYGLDDFDQVLDDPPVAAEPVRGPGEVADGNRPGDLWAAEHSWAEVLTADGAKLHRDVANSRFGPQQQWCRPGVDDHLGAVLHLDADLLKVFTSGWPGLEQGATYTKFGYLAATRHGGDHAAAAAALAAEGYRTDPATLVAGAGRIAVVAGLPEEFWRARPALSHIRQAAHSRQRSAEAVLGSVLARAAAIAPHTLRLPPIVGSAVPLSFYVATIAVTGIGKSSGSAIACELVPAPAWVADNLPIGSGEGIAEVLFDWVSEPDENGKSRRVKRQTRHNAFLFIDEGDVVFDIGQRKGATLLPTLRTAWTGGTLGQTNASEERKRIVPAGSYSYGIVLGLQPARAAQLLTDAPAGTPARFAFTSAHDPTVPDTPPAWPGALRWEPPSRAEVAGGITLTPAVEAEVRAADLARIRGRVSVDALDAHGTLLRLKAAALLAVLDGRRALSDDDWGLAGMFKARSDAERERLVATVAAEGERREAASRRRYAARAAAGEEATRRTRTIDGARRITAKVRAEPDRWTVAELRRSSSRWLREVWDDALDHAIAQRWVVEVSESSHTGDDRRRLRPGEAAP